MAKSKSGQGNAAVAERPKGRAKAATPAAPPAEEPKAPAPETPAAGETEGGDSDSTGGAGQETGLARTGGNQTGLVGMRLATIGGVAFTTAGAIATKSPTWSGWQQAWHFAGTMRETSKFWQGDLINLATGDGEDGQGSRYGEKYTQFLTESNYGTLRNMASIAGKIPVSERIYSNLEWSHYAVTGVLWPDHAEKAREILKDANAARPPWSVKQVKAEVREYRESLGESGGDAGAGGNAGGATSSVLIGLQPTEDGEYECTHVGCEPLAFPVMPWHCLTCGAHVPNNDPETGEDITVCPYHDPETGELNDLGFASQKTVTMDDDTDDDTGSSGGSPAPSGGAVRGQVLTPEDQIPADLNVSDLVAFAGFRGMPVAELGDAFSANDLPALMGLHEWLGRVIEYLTEGPDGEPQRQKAPRQPKAAKAATSGPAAGSSKDGEDGKPLAQQAPRPAPKPGGKPKRSKAPAAAPKAAGPKDADDDLSDADDSLPDFE